MLLLDEPLAALDAAHPASRSGLSFARHLAAFAGVTLLVTHDPVDALALADRLLVLETGRVVQDGDPREVARHPRTPYVARLVGLNLLAGEAMGRRVSLASGAELTVVAEAQRTGARGLPAGLGLGPPGTPGRQPPQRVSGGDRRIRTAG